MAQLKSKRVLREFPSFDDVRDWYDENLHPDKLDINDEEVYKHVYDESRFPAIFQFSSSGAQKLIGKFKPRTINDIAVATSIYRPGPLSAKVDKIYLKNKENVEKVKKSMHPLVWECLKDTYGTVVFQEQIMEVAHKVGGFDLDETDQVRKALMKRSMKEKGKAAEKVIILGERFIKGAIKNGLMKKEAEDLWDTLAFFSGYGFNKTLYHCQKIIVLRDNEELLITIGDVLPGDKVFSRDEKTKQCTIIEVLRKHDHGKLTLVEVELETGEKVKCTRDHKFRTTDGRMTPLWLIIEEDLDIVVDDVASFLAAKTQNGQTNI